VKAKFKKPTDYSASLRGDSADPTDYSVPREFDGALLTSSLRTVHTELSRKRFQETRPGDTERVSRFHKLDPEGICNTIRAGTASDHGAFTSPRPIHPFSPRCITVREAARLHSYPDWFRFHVTKWHGFRQIGNSVPPFAGASGSVQSAGIAPSASAALRIPAIPRRSGLAIVWHGGSRGQIQRAGGRGTEANSCATGSQSELHLFGLPSGATT
jgi:DNA (cytosine-5)-methyltransferase 1